MGDTERLCAQEHHRALLSINFWQLCVCVRVVGSREVMAKLLLPSVEGISTYIFYLF